jgi:hypothetical protein
MYLQISLLLPLLSSITAQTLIPPSTCPNGTANPFYPCGYTASQVSACPYRCYTSTGSLLQACYTLAQAKTLIAQGNICTQCENPSVFLSYDYPGGCQPLSNYFAGQPPSPCGFINHRLYQCAWICAEAQVPFAICSITNTTSEFSLCVPCQPQCSSPRIVFEPAYLPSNFSIAAGSCSAEYGIQELVACPWRCTTAGSPNSYCSLTNATGGPDDFTTCIECGGG